MPKGGGNRGKGKCIAWLRRHVSFSGDDCLIWPFSRDRDGYGQFGLDGRVLKAHRWMCEAENGPSPSITDFSAHECGNGHLGCVHPKHLRWKTQDENAADMVRHGTARSGKGIRRIKLTDVQIAEIKSLRGIKSDQELAPIYGVSSRLIRMIFQGRIWNGQSKRCTKAFCDHEVQQIRALKGVRKAKELASEYGVVPNVIYKIWARLSWTTVPEAEAA